MQRVHRYSSFSVILVTAALSLAGFIGVRGLNLRYAPAPRGRSLTVTVSLPDASPAVIEAEVTSRLEASLAGMQACRGISSTSSVGYASIMMDIDKGADLQAVRFEASTRIANLWPSFPPGTSYPLLSSGGSESGGGQVVWQLNSPLPAARIAEFAASQVIPALSAVSGVNQVDVSGATPFEWVVTYDYDKVSARGIHGTDIAEAIRAANGSQVVGLWNDGGRMMTVRLSTDAVEDSSAFYDIPVSCPGSGKWVRLGEIATFAYQESEPSSYFRLNGLNTVTLYATVSDQANLLTASKALRTEMSRLERDVFPDEIEVHLSYDSSEYVRGELKKIIFRTFLCLLILLVFSFLATRSWKQLLVLILSLTAGLSVSLGVYRLIGLPVHIYTLAGVTVSFGIMIDTSILMIDHYGKYRNRRAFSAVFFAVMTTVAALLMTLLLPEDEKLALEDFILVISVNLSVMLLVCRFFVPALMDVMNPPQKRALAMRNLRRRASVRSFYGRFIAWGMRHRWVFLVALALLFGLPVYLIPEASTYQENERSFWAVLVRWNPYASHRDEVDRVLGSLSGRFYRSLERSNIRREPARMQLTIRAGMPEGCTVAQLNEIVGKMEKYLSQFDQIESFTTSIRNYNDARIDVRFRKEWEDTTFPYQLKGEVTEAAIDFGGANWMISGVDDNYFNNNVVMDYKSQQITLRGYNFEKLHAYADQLVERLKENRRVSGPEIWAGGWWGRPATEIGMKYDREALAALGVSPYAYYSALSDRLYSTSAGRIVQSSVPVNIMVKSSEEERFDLWHVRSVPIPVDSTEIALGGIGDIGKQRTAVDINRSNQSYSLSVNYDFVGSGLLAAKFSEEAVAWMNNEVLPIGYKAEGRNVSWGRARSQSDLGLILLIILVIYGILAAAFESFRYPLAVILMIPVSFLGLFLAFGFGSLSFDQGGLAALVMLCGITVNAGIYLVPEYQSVLRAGTTSVHAYKVAFSRKVTPVSLTLLSTVLGLMPFLSDGPSEVFWFDFAIGTIAGLTMSVVAWLFFLPVFVCRN